jgi:hypothetical protein
VRSVIERHGSPARTGAAAAMLIVLGVLAWGGYRLAAGTENHAYSPNPVPPASVLVSRGHTYDLAYPGGVDALSAQGIDTQSLQCQWSPAGGPKQALAVMALGSGSTARNTVATFVAPASGPIHVACDGIGAMFVDDARDAGSDRSGWFLIAASVALTLGLPLALSAVRSRRLASGRLAREDDEIERLVDVVHRRVDDGEVVDADGDDVLE